MNEVLMNIDIMQILSTIWTVVLVPVIGYLAPQIHEYFVSKRIDKYTDILYEEVKKAVKSVYETTVKDIKSNKELWTPEKQEEVKEIAKDKALQALSNAAYKCLVQANSEFEDYLDTLIGTALYDVKHE